MKPIRITRRAICGAIAVAIGATAHAQSSSPPRTGFFPAGTFPPVRGQPDTRVAWYGRHLAAMGEHPLASAPQSGVEVYRFIHLPTWGRPFMVRIEHRAGRTTLTAVRLSGDGGYDPGHVEANATREVPEATWQELRRRIDAIQFFTMPTTDLASMGMDGEQWIVEGVRDGRYHLVDRWAPGNAQTRAWLEFCGWFAALAAPVWNPPAPRP